MDDECSPLVETGGEENTKINGNQDGNAASLASNNLTYGAIEPGTSTPGKTTEKWTPKNRAMSTWSQVSFGIPDLSSRWEFSVFFFTCLIGKKSRHQL